MCFGGSAPAAPPPPQLPQPAQTPAPATLRANTAQQTAAAGNSTLLTSGMGQPVTNSQLGSKSLLGL